MTLGKYIENTQYARMGEVNKRASDIDPYCYYNAIVYVWNDGWKEGSGMNKDQINLLGAIQTYNGREYPVVGKWYLAFHQIGEQLCNGHHWHGVGKS